MKLSNEITAKALVWARQFLTCYSIIPAKDIKAYAQGLGRKARTVDDPEKAAWFTARAEALQSLLKDR
jgi:hypothetical protein